MEQGMIRSGGNADYRTIRAVHRSYSELDLRNTLIEVNLIDNYYVPVPTIVHTLVSPISTCHRAPDDAPVSLEEPRLLETDPAELGRRRAFEVTFLAGPPALDVDLFFLTRPPSWERKSETPEGESGALPEPFPKYSLPLAESGVDEMGEPGRIGELDPWMVFH